MTDRERRKAISRKICPDCSAELTYDPELKSMVCSSCKLLFDYGFFTACKSEFAAENKQVITDRVHAYFQKKAGR